MALKPPQVRSSSMAVGAFAVRPNGRSQVKDTVKGWVTGFGKFAGSELPVRAEIGLREAASIAFEESQKLVPRETHALAHTGHVAELKKGEKTIANSKGLGQFALQYGGDTIGEEYVDYAVFVHEDMPSGVSKTYTVPGTGPKYVSQAVTNTLEKMKSAFKKHMTVED